MDKSPKHYINDKLESYYRIPTVQDNDFCVTDQPICINCVGYSQYNCTVCGDSIRKDFYCIYLTQGKISVTYPFQKTMHAGDMVIFSPNIPYKYTGLKPFSYYWIHFSGSCAEQFLSLCEIRVNEVIHPGISEKSFIALKKIMNTLKNRELFWESIAISELIRFLAETGKAINCNYEKKNVTMEMEKVAAYIQSNISKSISVNELAKNQHMSVSSFRNKFKEYAGMSPQEYINTVRLGEATRLLTTTDTSIVNIAAICGYNDPMYFSRIFHNKTGQSLALIHMAGR
ncbi:MAG: AraC family transcriptional regulator, partial [Eubacterium sp.]|nr:AraC family transcriptional regulator [Eubacterium sp.]